MDRSTVQGWEYSLLQTNASVSRGEYRPLSSRCLGPIGGKRSKLPRSCRCHRPARALTGFNRSAPFGSCSVSEAPTWYRSRGQACGTRSCKKWFRGSTMRVQRAHRSVHVAGHRIVVPAWALATQTGTMIRLQGPFSRKSATVMEYRSRRTIYVMRPALLASARHAVNDSL